MIKLTATATIKSISPVIEIPSRSGGNPFQKRELILDDSWIDKNQQSHGNFMLVEFSGEQMNMLNGYAPGQQVTVTARVQGREWNDKIIHSFRGESIAPVAAQAYPQQQPPQNNYGMIGPQTTYSQPAPYGQYGSPQQGYPQQQQPFGHGSFPQQPVYDAPFPT